MIRKVLAVAVATGLLAGLVMAAVLQVTTTPMILKAEVYERAAHSTAEGKSARVLFPRLGSLILRAHGTEPHPTVKEGSGWEPAEGFQRTLSTSVATVAVALGYAFVLIGCMVFARERIEPKRALLWAVAAFAASGLAPALGLAPELPGSAAGDLLLRQLWWALTTVATAAGLYLAIRIPQASAKVAGTALILAPHLVGAPHPVGFASTAPAELAASFAAASLVVHALLWCLVGLGVGWFWTRIAPDGPLIGARA